MRLLFCTLFFLFPLSIFASTITLKEKLSEATPGSYLVTEQSRNFTFLHVFEKRGDKLVLEEVTIPGEAFSSTGMGWKEWFESGAPGNTSWTFSQINLKTGEMEEVYSVTHGGWVNLNENEGFLTTLLNLHFQPVAVAERRHVGLPPGYGKPDNRPLWNPRLVVEGKMVSQVPFQVWKARWPADGSEMGRKTIEVYLPEAVNGSPSYPTYFPYWLEVEGKIGSAKIRVVDSGMEVRSIRTHVPHRKPTLINQGKWEKDHFILELKNPSHFDDFIVMAEESESLFGKSFPLPCQVIQKDDLTKIFLKKEDLQKMMQPGESYRFVLSPQEEPLVLIETQKSFILQKN